MQMTARDICIDALYDCGELAEGLDASQEQISKALRELNGLFTRLNSEGLTRYAIDKHSISTDSDTITIGAGADIDMSDRPKSVLSVYCNGIELRQVNVNDMPQIASTGRPELYAYNARNPIGVISVYPKPDQIMTFEIHYEVMFGRFALNDTIDLPHEYHELIRWSLADRLSKAFGMPRPDLQYEAERALRVLKSMNISMRELSIDADLI